MGDKEGVKIGYVLTKLLNVDLKHVEFIRETKEFDGEITEFNRRSESSACRIIQYHLENNKKSYIEVYKDILDYMIDNACYSWDNDYISAYIAENYSFSKNMADVMNIDGSIVFAQLYSILKSYKARFVVGIKNEAYIVNPELLYIYIENGCISDISFYDEFVNKVGTDNILNAQVVKIIPLDLDYGNCYIMYNEINMYKNKSVLELLGIKVKKMEVDKNKYSDIALLGSVTKKKYEDIYKTFVDKALFLTEDMQKHFTPNSNLLIHRYLPEILASRFDWEVIECEAHTTDENNLYPASCLDFLFKNKEGKFIIDTGLFILLYDNGTIINSIDNYIYFDFEHYIINAGMRYCRRLFELELNNK